MSKLIPVIGIEVHCELKSNKKIFSNSDNKYGEIVNTLINEIDLGYPGTLPIVNKEIIDISIKAALLFNCNINKVMFFDRKNYFYPDLSKGYQITQKHTPIGLNGYVEISNKKVYIEEMHLEEDTAKSMYENNNMLLDYNRAGVPLLEIVSKPDMNSSIETVEYIEKLREILLYGGISDVKIEEGSLRCDLNISLKEESSNILGTKVEIKNVSSLSAIKDAIDYEIERQRELINKGIKIVEETRRFDEGERKTVLMRVKDSSSYRYFQEPNIPIINIDDSYIESIRKTIPLLPDQLRKMYTDLGLNNITINALINNVDLNNLLLKLIDNNVDPVISANIITGDILGYLNKNSIRLKDTSININNLKDLINKIESKEISSKIGKTILDIMFNSNDNVDKIMKDNNLKLMDNKEELINIIKNILTEELINDYNNNPERIIKYIVGQVMKETKGQANPILVNELLVDIISTL